MGKWLSSSSSFASSSRLLLETETPGLVWFGVTLDSFLLLLDVIILAPTLVSIKNMLKTAKKFSVEYNISFNLKKSKFILFAQGLNVNVDYVMFEGVRLNAEESCKHLGYILGPNVQKMRIDQGINELYRKAKMVLAQFGHADTVHIALPVVKLHPCTNMYNV